MREAIKLAAHFFTAPAWKGYVIGPIGPLANATSDDLLDQYVRNFTGTGAHPVGTAAMSSRNANYGVVNPDLLVKGVTGLRIVDASIMVSDLTVWIGVFAQTNSAQPFIPTAHTQAAVYIIAERAADLIKARWEQ